MALDSKTFKTRTLSAIVFVVLMLSGLFINQWSFIGLFLLVHFGCWYEFLKLIKKIYPGSYKLRSLLGLPYISVPVALLIYMRVRTGLFINDNLLLVIPCGIIFSIWINDTMAYIVGSFIGKTPLSKISPKKTWEGTIGGALLCITAITFVGYIAGFYCYINWIIIASCCAFFGTLGDLMESKIKRMAKVKDSGSIMPGHGGFLDRFDSLLIATPFVACYYLFFM